MKRLALLLGTLLCLVMPATALAYNPLGGACGAGGTAKDSSACNASKNDPVSGTNGILRKVANIIAILAGVAAVIIIIIGGLQYVTSGGDPQKAAGARTMIIGAAVGLVIIAAAQTILVFVLNRIK